MGLFNNSEIRRLREENKRLSDDNRKLYDSNKRLWTDNKRLYDDNKTLYADNKRLCDENSKITSSLNAVTTKNKKLNDENSKITYSLNEVTAKNKRLNDDYAKMDGIIKNLSSRIGLLTSELDDANTENNKLRYDYAGLEAVVENLSDSVDATVDEQFKNIVKSSDTWGETYDEAVAHSKELVKQGKACKCDTKWTIDGNRTKGEKMVHDGIKLALLVFDTIVDRACNYVKHSNFESLAKKVQNAFTKINALNKTNEIYITDEYLKAKLTELEVMYRYRVQKEIERERIKELKRRALEEKREKEKLDAEESELQAKLNKQREIEEAAKQLLVKELNEKQELLNKQKDNADEITKLQGIIDELNIKVKEAEDRAKISEEALIEKIVQVQDKKETLQSGFVYVISNYGAFGENVFKIGVTRRSDPLDRVNELGNASVPFKFNVHSIIPSDEAFKLENNIHRRLRKYRVNLVNNHKEFFKIGIDELHNILSEMVEDLEFSNDISEEQYIETVRIRNDPMEFQKWLENYKEQKNNDEDDQLSNIGVIDTSVLDQNSIYKKLDSYDKYYNDVAQILDGLSSKPVMRITKYYVAIYLALENNMKKLMTFYKSGDGSNIISFSIHGYDGNETSGTRKSIQIYNFDIYKYSDIIIKSANKIDNDLIDISSINI